MLEMVVNVENLSKSFGRVRAVRDLSFAVAAGKIRELPAGGYIIRTTSLEDVFLKATGRHLNK